MRIEHIIRSQAFCSNLSSKSSSKGLPYLRVWWRALNWCDCQPRSVRRSTLLLFLYSQAQAPALPGIWELASPSEHAAPFGSRASGVAAIYKFGTRICLRNLVDHFRGCKKRNFLLGWFSSKKEIIPFLICCCLILPFFGRKKAVKVAARITRYFVYYLFFNKKVGAWTTQKLPYGLTRTALTSALFVPRNNLKFSWFLNKLIWFD